MWNASPYALGSARFPLLDASPDVFGRGRGLFRSTWYHVRSCTTLERYGGTSTAARPNLSLRKIVLVVVLVAMRGPQRGPYVSNAGLLEGVPSRVTGLVFFSSVRESSINSIFLPEYKRACDAAV